MSVARIGAVPASVEGGKGAVVGNVHDGQGAQVGWV